MIKQIIVLSGAVSSGKTTLANSLHERFGLKIFKTSDYLKTIHPKVETEREAMQILGEKMDKRTGGQWVCDGLTKYVQKLHNDENNNIIIVDSVRIKKQIDEIRRVYNNVVVHIHLETPQTVLEARYKSRDKANFKELATYEMVMKNRTESKVGDLRRAADILIDTDRCQEHDVMVRAASRLGLYGKEYLRLVDVLIGGQYGSEGKGNIVNYIAREYSLLVRVGGPNAGHKVYSEPSPYTFHQLPSGTRSAEEARLLIGPGATIDLPVLMREVAECQVTSRRLSIDPHAMIISEQDKDNEKILTRTMGSTGQGVGSATARRIINRIPSKLIKSLDIKKWGSLVESVKLAQDVRELRPFIRESCEVLEDAFRNGDKVFLEGTQGTGLSLYHGYYPFVTSRDTTVAGCLSESGISANRIRKIVMVCRTYPIRVQNPKGKGRSSGPMMRELRWSEIERRSKHPEGAIEGKEVTSTTGRERRVGEFEWASLRKAASINAPTDIALTFVDYIDKINAKARRFDQLTQETIRFIEEIERVSSAPVSLISTRFNFRNIIDRRNW